MAINGYTHEVSEDGYDLYVIINHGRDWIGSVPDEKTADDYVRVFEGCKLCQHLTLSSGRDGLFTIRQIMALHLGIELSSVSTSQLLGYERARMEYGDHHSTPRLVPKSLTVNEMRNAMIDFVYANRANEPVYVEVDGKLRAINHTDMRSDGSVILVTREGEVNAD